MHKFCLFFLLLLFNRATAQFDAIKQYEAFKKFHTGINFTNGRFSIVEIDKLYGVIDKDLNVKIPIINQSISIVNDAFAICEKDSLFYLIDIESNKIIIPQTYLSIAHFSRNLFICQYENKFGIINSQGKILLPFDYDEMYQIKNNLLRLKSKNKFALLDENLEFVIKLDVDFIMDIGQEFCVLSNDSFYIYNKNGVKLSNGMSFIPLAFDRNQIRYSITLAEEIKKIKSTVGINSYKEGIINASGKEIIPCIYDEISNWTSFYAADLNGKTYLFNRQGKLLNRPEIDKYSILSKYLVEVKIGKSYGIMDSTGKLIYEAKYGLISKKSSDLFSLHSNVDVFDVKVINKFGNNLTSLGENFLWSNKKDQIIIVKENLYGIKNISGKTLLPIEYSSIKFCEAYSYENLYPNDFNSYIIERDNKCKFLSSSLLELDGINYEKCDCFSDGLAKVMMNGKYGYCDSTGKVIVDFKYEEAEPFISGHAMVKLNGLNGLINLKGQVVLECEFDNARFNYGLCKTSKLGLYGLYNIDGKQLLPNKFNDISISDLGVIVQLDNYFGLYSKEGKLVIPIENESIECMESIFFVVRKNGLQAIYDYEGKILLPYKYKKIRIFGSGTRIEATTVSDENIEITMEDKIYKY